MVRDPSEVHEIVKDISARTMKEQREIEPIEDPPAAAIGHQSLDHDGGLSGGLGGEGAGLGEAAIPWAVMVRSS